MDELTDPAFPSQAELATSLPDYRLDPEPAVTTGMSRIYYATDTRLHHRKVAVKIMTEYLAAHPAFRKRFLLEIRLLARLEHPNIMHVLAAAADDDPVPYLVMPRAEGDLRTRLAERRLTLAATAHVVTQVAAALDYAHDQGVIHRDVKPGNILFGKTDHVYLCDFGVAKTDAGEDLTQPGETVGTNRYTAPEVYGARAVDATEAPDETTTPTTAAPLDARQRAGDVYSLGAVLYHCLTGNRPFDLADDSAAAAAQRRGELPAVSDVRPELPAALDAVVAKAMDLDPRRRHRSCGELADALVDAIGLSGSASALPVLREILERIPSQRIAATEVLPPPAQGPRRATTLTLAVALVVLAVLVGVLVFAFLSEDSRSGTPDEAAGSGEAAPSMVAASTPEPVTGDDRVKRHPIVGECIDDSDDFYVVACDSSAATDLVYRIVRDPKDPNPAQPDHEDAAWKVCGGDDIDYTYHWEDSADADDYTEWNPETDRIYWIMCTREV